jgi:hypothetical protein
VEESLPMVEVLLQVKDTVTKDVDTKVEDVVLVGINVVAILIMPTTIAGMLHVHGKCAMAILMDRIIGQDFSLNHKAPQVAVVEMVEDSNLDVARNGGGRNDTYQNDNASNAGQSTAVSMASTTIQTFWLLHRHIVGQVLICQRLGANLSTESGLCRQSLD